MIARRMSWAGTTLLSLAIVLPAVAQAPPGAPGGGGGGMAQFQKFREQHKYTFQLQRMIRGLGEIDKDPSTKLTSGQAKGLMGVLKPWQAKDKMTQDDAKNVMKATKKLLTTKQLNALSRIPDRRPG